MLTRNLQCCCLAAMVCVAAEALLAAAPDAVDPAVVTHGRELFGRVWEPNDARSPGGDGLGPVFNDTSCVACHSQAGLGGAGSIEHNVRVVTISTATSPQKKALMHPGFQTQTSLVLHHGSVEPRYDNWRQRLVKRAERVRSEDGGEEVPEQLRAAMKNYQQGLERGANALAAITNTPNPFFTEAPAIERRAAGTMCGCGFGNRGGWGTSAAVRPFVETQPAGTLTMSERNSTALFGAGLIDRIPDTVIEAAAAEEKVQSPKTAGRVPKLTNQRIGHFGWHAQQASLADFAMTACAVELGLSVPGHPQAGNPMKPKYESPGMDMTPQDCVALVAYLAALPRPAEPEAGKPQIEQGRKLFAFIGCADCHRANLGEVSGLYSDLLMHDMGSGLKGGGYGAFTPEAAAARPAGEAWHGDAEWRTPPLWGVASSAPYLHDGRAATLREAIVLHGGQAEASAEKFHNLAQPDQQRLIAFLSSLVAPATAEKPADAPIKPHAPKSKKPARATKKAAQRVANNAHQ